MHQVTVKTLTGLSLSLELDLSDTSIAALRQHLHEQGHVQLKGCRLFFNGIKLQDEKAPLPNAATLAGAFLVAVPVSAAAHSNVSRHVRAVRQHEDRAEAGLEAPSAGTHLNPSALGDVDAIPYQGQEAGQLDTLLAGYSIRPSPVKPMAKLVQAAEADKLQEEGGGGLLPARAAAAEGRRRPRSPLEPPSGRPGSTEPLPEASVGASDQCQQKRQRNGKRPVPSDGSMGVAALPAGPAATALMPKAARKSKGIKATEKAAEGGQPGPSAPPPPPLTNAPSDQRAASERLVSRLPLPPALLQLRQTLAALGEVHRFLSSQRVSPTWHALATVMNQAQGRQSGSGREGEEAGVKLEDVFHLAAIVPAVVALKDRSRPHDDGAVVCPRPLLAPLDAVFGEGGGGCIEADAAAQGWPSQLIQQVSSNLGRGAEGGGAGGELQGACPPMEVTHRSLVVDILDPGRILSSPADGSEGAYLSATPAALLSRCGALGANKVDRCLAAFTRSAVAAVLQLHSQFLAQMDQQGRANGELGCGGLGPGYQEPPEPLDPVQTGKWHPHFPWQSVSVQEAIQTINTLQRALQAPGTATGAEAVAGPGQAPPGEAPSDTTLPMSPTQLVAHMSQLGYADRMVHQESLPARPARHAQPGTALAPPVLRALQARGASRMFSHQAEAIDSILGEGQHTVIATSTASGKSLCFQVPILAAFAASPSATALLMFPTKALAQDQLGALKSLLAAAFGPEAADWAETYDGDTAQSDREEIRSRCRLLITNPDMLHLSVLPSHGQFQHLLANLKYVALDEGHYYYGAFGSHTSMVIRRLRRLCHHYGSDPIFIVASATIANPQHHAQLLLGVPHVHLVDRDGSPHGPKTYVMWNPPLRNPPAVPIQPTEASQRGLPAKVGGLPAEAAAGSRAASLPPKADASSGGQRAGLSHTGVPEAGVARAGLKVFPRAQISAAELELATQALASVQATGSSCLSGRGSAAPGQPSTCAIPGATTAPCVLWTSSGSRKLTMGSGASSIIGSATNGLRLQQLRREVEQRMPCPREWSARMRAEAETNRLEDPSRRLSPVVEVSLLLAQCIQHGLRTIAFCKSRKMCELVATYTLERLAAAAPQLLGLFKVYRGGYSPVERRSIEAELFSGRLMGVAATNALELGVDVGSLDVTLHLGFQGSIASMRQQAGRAGRREQESMAIYVAFEGPLDQHFMRHPEDLFGRPIEHVQLDTSNEAVVTQHVMCAAAELALTPVQGGLDSQLFGPQLPRAVAALKAQGLLGTHPRLVTAPDPQGGSDPTTAAHHPLFYTGSAAGGAARSVTLRCIDPEQFVILDESSRKVLEQVEGRKAFYQVYDGAVYLHQGRTFLCRQLDLNSRVAVVRPADVKYYTKLQDFTDIHVTGGRVAYPSQPDNAASAAYPKTTASCETALVTVRFLGFQRIWQRSGKRFDFVELHLPDVLFETQATYVRVPAAALEECAALGLDYRAGLHAASHAVLAVLPLHLLCNARDVGADCDSPLGKRFRVERLLLYDRQQAGGVGLCSQAAPMFRLLLQRALELLSSCPCDGGCPSCVHHVECPSYNAMLCKAGARVVLKHILQAEGALDRGLG